MSEPIANLVFPDYLRNSEYQTRCVTFYACASKIMDTVDTDQALEENALSVEIEESVDAGTFAMYDSRNALKGSVTLPYPNSLSDSQQHRWDAEEGLLSQVTSGAVNVASSKLGNTKTGAAAKKVLDATGTNAGKLYSGLTNAMGVRKVVKDPGLFQNYSGSQPRSFTMAYTFIPLNQGEAKTIKEIIRWFKYYSSPEFNTLGVTMTSPHIFEVSFAGNPYVSELFNMKKCVITSLNVDYAADGSFALFQDGFPKQINMSMTFAEMRVTYAQEYAGAKIP